VHDVVEKSKKIHQPEPQTTMNKMCRCIFNNYVPDKKRSDFKMVSSGWSPLCKQVSGIKVCLIGTEHANTEQPGSKTPFIDI